MNLFPPLCCFCECPALEWWQIKRVTTVLDPEDAEEKAVHDENNTAPYEYCNLLLLRIGHARDFQCEGNRRKRKGTV